MPITFQTEPLRTGYLNVFNPAVFEFTSTEDSTFAEVQIDGRPSVAKVDADPDGVFSFDAQDWLRAYFDFDFTDPNYTREDSIETNFTDTYLTKTATLQFRVGSDFTTKDYRLFLASLPIGTTPPNLGTRLPLTLTNKLPVSIGDYQELPIFASRRSTVRGTIIFSGYNRIRVKTQSDVDRLNNNLGVELVPYNADGLRLKYFSSAGSWVYLKSQCPYRTTTEVMPGDVVPTTRRNIQVERSTFKTLRKIVRKTYILPFEYNLGAYINDLMGSLGVFLRLDDKWFGVQVNNTQHTEDSNDPYGRILLSVSYNERDPQTQI